ncbi:MAG TPA: Insertion element protein [Pseudonocardiaceae bacterium]|jgi:transposase-like protein|nr:Insertion element protein [Pseudonocardiaceae bacterium]
MTQTRAVPFYCPYCGDEDLRPEEQPAAAWRCADCQRVFVVRLVALVAPAQEAAR